MQLTNVPAKFNWCAYVSDYPPNVTAANGTYTFKGTPPFTLTASNGATQTVTGTTLAASALTVTPTTIRDKTACPGVFCIYSGSDLYIDATHLCQQRTSGAKNWEAWIKDTRDNELYRIVLMPDNNWWLAQNVKLASYNGSAVGTAVSGCTNNECGRWYLPAVTCGSYGGTTTGYGANVQGVCPNDWILPVNDTWTQLALSLDANVLSAVAYLTPSGCSCPKNDAYSWAGDRCLHHTTQPTWGGSWHSNSGEKILYIACANGFAADNYNGQNTYSETHTVGRVVRCFRQL